LWCPRRTPATSSAPSGCRSGLTEEDLAYALGISYTTVSRWENGRMKPGSLAWQALAQLAAENGRPLLGVCPRNVHSGSDSE